MSVTTLARSIIITGWLLAVTSTLAAEDTVLFGFEEPASSRDWAPVKLPEVEKEQPAPQVEVFQRAREAHGNALKITFAGGDWPVIGTSKIPVKGSWKAFQTLRAVLTVDRPSVAYFRIYQGQADDKPRQPRWEKTLILLPGRNEVNLMIRHGLSSAVIDPARGDIASFLIGMYQPVPGQTLLVQNVGLSPDWPPPKTLGWYSPYNHDGYSAAAARDYQRTGAIPTFKVLGTDLEVADLPELARKLKDRWVKPEPKTLELVQADFRAELEKLKPTHPRAVLAILRDGEKGWSPAHPDQVYSGWKMVYLNSHGPDGPNKGREATQPLQETVEAFMRHRSVLMRADLSGIPRGATILAARLVVTRASARDLKVPEKPNLWVAEPCNRDWDEASANCYFHARGKHWKAVNGLYYGEDPDFWPVFLAHGPAGGGAVSVWDFTEALKFWQDGKHPNHGFFLHGDSNDYMRMYTSRAREVAQRPAILVIYDPKS
jgi:hypothetical protein